MTKTMKITYSGRPSKTRDNIFDEEAKRSGYEFVGSGYNFKTDIRDMEFEQKA